MTLFRLILLLLLGLAQFAVFAVFLDCRFSQPAYLYYTATVGVGFPALLALALLSAGLAGGLLLARPFWQQQGARWVLLGLAIWLSGLYALVCATLPVARDFWDSAGAALPQLTAQVMAGYPWAGALPALAWAGCLVVGHVRWRARLLDGLLIALIAASLLFSLYVAGLFAPLLGCCKIV